MFVIMRVARELYGFVESREFVLLPLAGVAVAGLAIAFEAATDHSVNDVLFSGEAALPGLVSGAGTWSVSALAAGHRLQRACLDHLARQLPGRPHISRRCSSALPQASLASHLPGFDETAAVAVGLGAATVSALGLPLSAVVLATLLTAKSGAGATATRDRRSGRRIPHDARAVAAGSSARARRDRWRPCLSRSPRPESTGG